MNHVLLFIAGALLANFVPHFVHGVSGKSFFLPRRTDREKLNSPLLNVLWAFTNLALAVVILAYVFEWSGYFLAEILSIVFGALSLSVINAISFKERRKLGEISKKSVHEDGK